MFHFPEKPTTSQVEMVKLLSKVSRPACLLHADSRFSITALIDSGTVVNLIDRNLVHELNLPTIPCTPPLRVTTINDQPIDEGLLTHQTSLMELQTVKELHFSSFLLHPTLTS